MKLSYQYHIKPNTERSLCESGETTAAQVVSQKLMLNHVLRLCQYLYNRMLGERLDWWETDRCYIDACPLICHLTELKEYPSYYSQKALLPLLKQDLILVKQTC